MQFFIFINTSQSSIFNIQLLNDTLFYENLLQSNHRAVYLLMGMGGHESVTHEGVLRSTCRWDDGVDEHTGLEGEGGHKERLVHIAHIERNDRTLGIANLEAFFTETLQGIVGDIPKGSNALGLFLDDMESLHGCRKLMVSQSEAMKPPMEASDLEKVPMMRSISSVSPK